MQVSDSRWSAWDAEAELVTQAPVLSVRREEPTQRGPGGASGRPAAWKAASGRESWIERRRETLVPCLLIGKREGRFSGSPGDLVSLCSSRLYLSAKRSTATRLTRTPNKIISPKMTVRKRVINSSLGKARSAPASCMGSRVEERIYHRFCTSSAKAPLVG